MPGRDRDDAAVQRRGRVVGVALERARVAQHRGAGGAGAPTALRDRGEQARHAGRARVAEAATTREGRRRPASGPSPPACRNARTAGCVSDAGSPRSLTSTCRSSATATASNAGPRFADDAGTRTTQSRCGGSCRRAGSQIGTARARPAGTFISVQRQCARSGCSAVATATFTFDAREQTVWLDAPRDGNARAGELCERHAGSLTPPQGWRLDDRRGVVPSTAPVPPVPRSPGTGRHPARCRPSPSRVAPDEHCPAPHEVTTPALDLLLRARSPLLARAFQSAGNH